MKPLITELMGVIEMQSDASPVQYRVLAVHRVPTLASELAQAVKEGYEFVAMADGPELAVVVQKKP